MEEFVVVDLILVEQERFIPIAEAKRYSLEQAIKQCLLLMKDMRDKDGGGEVQSTVSLQQGKAGKCSNTIEGMVVLFPTMAEDKNRRIKDCPTLVDCLNVVLNKRRIVK